ncbi:MAG: DnaJ domain-containing protein [Cytophagales bacterium]|nr:DnaJ domain-containing protein [Cytophagales bacterium]
MSRNKYLRILELQPGVSKKEIKQAYRRLSKKYHPDVSKDVHAKEKFISINEAYKFLMEVGAHPRQQQASSPAYEYNAHDAAFEAWRRKARDYARKRAAEAERERSLLIKDILICFNYVAVAIALFDTLLAIDYIIPYQIRRDEILGMEKVRKVFDRRYGDRDFSYKYLDISLHTNHIRLTAQAQLYFNDHDPVMITSTRIFNTPVSLENISGDPGPVFEQAYGIYRGFGFLIPIVMICLLFYGFIVKNQENRFSLAIVLAMLFIIQLYIFIAV